MPSFALFCQGNGTYMAAWQDIGAACRFTISFRGGLSIIGRCWFWQALKPLDLLFSCRYARNLSLLLRSEVMVASLVAAKAADTLGSRTPLLDGPMHIARYQRIMFLSVGMCLR